jgi:hypothetical protein
MATKIGSGSNLAPGGTHVWWWNNYVFEDVYTFAAHPLAASYMVGQTQAQVTSVKYVVIPHHDAYSTNHIEIVVSNPGGSATSYDLFMTVA